LLWARQRTYGQRGGWNIDLLLWQALTGPVQEERNGEG
jgi:hypothetical protein